MEASTPPSEKTEETRFGFAIGQRVTIFEDKPGTVDGFLPNAVSVTLDKSPLIHYWLKPAELTPIT